MYTMLDKLCKNDLVSTIVEITKPKNIDTFLFQHFKRTGHSDNVIVQPGEKISYDSISST